MSRLGALLGVVRAPFLLLSVTLVASGAAALEATTGFRALSPEDPVRYDFALTRLGIRADADVEDFLGEGDATEAA